MILSPSLLSANFGTLEQELQKLEAAGLSWVHWDVMDGMFVPNITFGAPIIRCLRKTTKLFFDVHLMVVEPERYIADFAEAGADLLVIHAEATRHLDRALQEIQRHGMKAGVALNPATPVCMLENVVDYLDLVLIMSVNPGFGGQNFISRSYGKIQQLEEVLRVAGSPALIEVDGGVTPENTFALVEAGADALVSGSAFFSHPPYKERVQAFVEQAAASSRVTKTVWR